MNNLYFTPKGYGKNTFLGILARLPFERMNIRIVIDRKVEKSSYLYYNAYYLIHYDDTSYEDEWVLQDQVGVIVG